VGVTRGPGGAPIDGSSARYLPDAVLSSAYRARDVASGVLCHVPRRIRHRCRISFASGRSIWLRRRLVKDDAGGRIRTPSIAECFGPGPSSLDQAPLVDFYNPTIREHGRVLA